MVIKDIYDVRLKKTTLIVIVNQRLQFLQLLQTLYMVKATGALQMEEKQENHYHQVLTHLMVQNKMDC